MPVRLAAKEEEAEFSVFLRPEDGRDFSEIVQDMSHAERDAGSIDDRGKLSTDQAETGDTGQVLRFQPLPSRDSNQIENTDVRRLR